MDTKVSVIIPVYNIEIDFLNDCFKSISNQTYNEFEAIVVDDGSIKSVADYCDSFSKKDNRFHVIHIENSGVSNARNIGINQAIGKYILFVDGDDWIEKDTILWLVKVMEEYKTDIAICNYIYDKKNKHDKEKNEFSCEVLDDTNDLFLLRKFMLHSGPENRWHINGAPWAKLYKKEMLVSNDIFFKKELIRSQDNEFNFRVFRNIKSVGYIKAKLYHYRYNNNSAVNKCRENSFIINNLFIEAVINDMTKEEQKLFAESVQKIIYSKLIENCIVDYCHINNKKKSYEKIKGIRMMLDSYPYNLVVKKTKGVDGIKQKIIDFIINTNNEYIIWLFFYVRNKIKEIIV